MNINMAFLQLLKLVLGMLYLTHILGCAWFWLADTNSEDPDTWLTVYDHSSGVDAGVWVQYLYSFYWSLMTLTTIGYGDITPKNDSERMFALLCFLLGALVFGYTLSSIGEMVKVRQSMIYF